MKNNVEEVDCGFLPVNFKEIVIRNIAAWFESFFLSKSLCLPAMHRQANSFFIEIGEKKAIGDRL